jgi:hypothetical protein
MAREAAKSYRGEQGNVLRRCWSGLPSHDPSDSPPKEKRRKLRDVVTAPQFVRLKFCQSPEDDVASDNEFDYANYRVETDPDLVQYHRDKEFHFDPDWDVTEEDLQNFTQADFDEYWEEYIHKKRTRSDPSVKRAHHAWWRRMRREQSAASIVPARLPDRSRDLGWGQKVPPDFLDEYASDDGTSIDFYSVACPYSVSAMRKAAIQQYKLPADQEMLQSVEPPSATTPRTYQTFRLEYYDALHTKTWRSLSRLEEQVGYYVRAERAIPLWVPLQFRSIILEETDFYRVHPAVDDLPLDLDTGEAWARFDPQQREDLLRADEKRLRAQIRMYDALRRKAPQDT